MTTVKVRAVATFSVCGWGGVWAVNAKGYDSSFKVLAVSLPGVVTHLSPVREFTKPYIRVMCFPSQCHNHSYRDMKATGTKTLMPGPHRRPMKQNRRARGGACVFQTLPRGPDTGCGLGGCSSSSSSGEVALGQQALHPVRLTVTATSIVTSSL